MLFVKVLKYVICERFEQHYVQLYCQVAMFTSLQTNKLRVKPTAKQSLCFVFKSSKQPEPLMGFY